MQITVRNVDELTAAVPHVLGFHPSDSLVVAPVTPGLPFARVDLPTTTAGRSDAVEMLLSAYARHAEPGAAIALLAYSNDELEAEASTQALTDEFRNHGVDVHMRVLVGPSSWTDLDTRDTGDRTVDARTMMAAEFVVAGQRPPLQRRDDLAGHLQADPAPLAALIPQSRTHAAMNGPTAERAWAAHRIDQFDRDGTALSDTDAARLLVAVDDLKTRDDALVRITRDNAPSAQTLWTDLTRRAPEEVKAPAATLLGFSSWLRGDGAGAWVALDQIPDGFQSYRLARLLAQALQEAVPPSAWDGVTPAPGNAQPGGVLPDRLVERLGPDHENEHRFGHGPEGQAPAR